MEFTADSTKKQEQEPYVANEPPKRTFAVPVGKPFHVARTRSINGLAAGLAVTVGAPNGGIMGISK